MLGLCCCLVLALPFASEIPTAFADHWDRATARWRRCRDHGAAALRLRPRDLPIHIPVREPVHDAHDGTDLHHPFERAGTRLQFPVGMHDHIASQSPDLSTADHRDRSHGGLLHPQPLRINEGHQRNADVDLQVAGNRRHSSPASHSKHFEECSCRRNQTGVQKIMCASPVCSSAGYSRASASGTASWNSSRRTPR